MKMPRFRPYWGRITAAITAALVISASPAIFTGEWNRALGGLCLVAAALLCGLIGYRIGHANAIAERAYQVELARGPDKDPFHEQLRVERRDDPSTTDTTGETR